MGQPFVNLEIFENLISKKSVKKKPIRDIKNLRLEHDLPVSLNNRVILLFRESFIFMKLRICEVC